MIVQDSLSTINKLDKCVYKIFSHLSDWASVYGDTQLILAIVHVGHPRSIQNNRLITAICSGLHSLWMSSCTVKAISL